MASRKRLRPEYYTPDIDPRECYRSADDFREVIEPIAK